VQRVSHRHLARFSLQVLCVVKSNVMQAWGALGQLHSSSVVQSSLFNDPATIHDRSVRTLECALLITDTVSLSRVRGIRNAVRSDAGPDY
jgi:hypothetical protein